jgi:hypothetical protein
LAEKFSEKLAFLTQNKAKFCKFLIIKLVFEKNANFFAENCRKSQKIEIISSTPAQFAQVESICRSTRPRRHMARLKEGVFTVHFFLYWDQWYSTLQVWQLAGSSVYMFYVGT